MLAQTVVRASARGYGEAVRSAERHARGVRAWAVEGAGHYGAGLTRDLGERGETVPSRSAAKLRERRLRGKDDRLDQFAVAARACGRDADAAALGGAAGGVAGRRR